MSVHRIGSRAASIAGPIEAARGWGVSYFSSTIMFTTMRRSPGFKISVLGFWERGWPNVTVARTGRGGQQQERIDRPRQSRPMEKERHGRRDRLRKMTRIRLSFASSCKLRSRASCGNQTRRLGLDDGLEATEEAPVINSERRSLGGTQQVCNVGKTTVGRFQLSAARALDGMGPVHGDAAAS